MFHLLKPNPGSKKKSRRVGRGSGSGRGTTAGRGQKGQQSRTGKGRRLGFEGGQTPFLRRQPKLGGFKRPMKVIYEVLNLDTLERKIPAGAYDVTGLKGFRAVSGKRPVKLLGRGAVMKKYDLKIQDASESAKKAIEKAGGSITIAKLERIKNHES